MFLDTNTNQPSITITYSIVTFLLAVASVVLFAYHLILWPVVIATISFWFLATILYIIRKINKASFDIKTKTFSIENDNALNDTVTTPQV